MAEPGGESDRPGGGSDGRSPPADALSPGLLLALPTLAAELERVRRELGAAQEELARERERAEWEAAEREELLTVVSHELRTPLTVIAGFNKLLLSERGGPLTEEQRHFLEESARSCRRLATFVGNLLGAARESAGEAPPELSRASLASTLEGVVRFLKPLVDERRQRVALELGRGAEHARFDPFQLERVLTNLLANAVRYSPPEGTIRVRAWSLQESARRFVELAVDDEGPGIPEPERERVFRAYVRGADGAGGRGLGLGLALCRRIVEAHGGRLRAATAPEGGARLVFTLPAAEAEED